MNIYANPDGTIDITSEQRDEQPSLKAESISINQDGTAVLIGVNIRHVEVERLSADMTTTIAGRPYVVIQEDRMQRIMQHQEREDGGYL